jgi:hypothetical protein
MTFVPAHCWLLLGIAASLAISGAPAVAQSVQEPKKSSDEELVKQLSNPIASLISVPFQNNWDFHLGAGHGWRYDINFQPVVPIQLNHERTLIVRTIVPFIHQEDLLKGVLDQVTLPDDVVVRLKDKFSQSQTGLGDIVQSFFLSPSKGLSL